MDTSICLWLIAVVCIGCVSAFRETGQEKRFLFDGIICRDRVNCSEYKDPCSMPYHEWAMLNCPLFCHYCQDGMRCASEYCYHGVCTQTWVGGSHGYWYNCSCSPGYTGEFCQYRENTPKIDTTHAALESATETQATPFTSQLLTSLSSAPNTLPTTTSAFVITATSSLPVSKISTAVRLKRNSGEHNIA